MSRGEMMSVRLSEYEAQCVKTEARRSGMTVSAYIRSVLLFAAMKGSSFT